MPEMRLGTNGTNSLPKAGGLPWSKHLRAFGRCYSSLQARIITPSLQKTRDEQQSQEKDQSMKYPNPVGDTPAGFFQVTGSAGFENPFFTNDSKEGDEADTNDEGAPSFFRQFRPESLRAPLHQQSVWQGEWIREAHQYYQPGDEIASAQIHAIQALQRAKEHDSETRIADEAMLHASKG